MRRKKLVGIGLVLVLLVTVVACSSNDNSESPELTESAELYVKVPDGKADVFVLNTDEEVITYKEQVEAAKFTNLSSGDYKLAVGKIGYSLFKKEVTVEGSTNVEADLESVSSPPVTINISATDGIGSELSNFTALAYKNGQEKNRDETTNGKAVIDVWPGVIYDYQVKTDNHIDYKYKDVNNVYLKDSGTTSLKASLLVGQKQEFSASETKTVNLGTLKIGETAVVGVSPLNFNPTDNTAVSASTDITYSQTNTSSSLVKLSSKQQKFKASAVNVKSTSSSQIKQTSQAQKLLDKQMRELEKELKLNSQQIIQPDKNQNSITASDLSIGAEKSFYVQDSLSENPNYPQVSAILKRKTENVYIFVEQGENIDSTKLDNLANKFNGIYKTNMNYFADNSYNNENLFDIDNNGRPIVLITDLQHLSDGEGTISGFFSSLNYFDDSNSNRADMMYINSYIVKQGSSEVNYASSVLAHEFQHLIYFIEDITSWIEAGKPEMVEEHWLNEGFSGLAEYLNGYYTYTEGVKIYDDSGENLGYFNTPTDESLLYWNQKLSDYGASNLFALYLYDQYGSDIIKEVNSTYKAPREIISNYTGREFSDLFLDWILTNQITDQAITDRYSYYQSDNGVQVTLGSSPKSQLITGNETGLGLNIKPNAVKYYKIEGNGSQVTLDIQNFNQPAGVIIHRQ